jgi:hypothetical protein
MARPLKAHSVLPGSGPLPETKPLCGTRGGRKFALNDEALNCKRCKKRLARGS